MSRHAASSRPGTLLDLHSKSSHDPNDHLDRRHKGSLFPNGLYTKKFTFVMSASATRPRPTDIFFAA